MNFRPLTGLYLSFLNGTPLQNALVKIKLSKNDYDLTAGFPVEEIEVRTTATGNLPAGLTIWTTGDGLEQSKAVFTEPDGFKWEAVVPPGTAPISAQELRANGTVITPPETVISIIENSDLERLRDVEFGTLNNNDAVVWDAVTQKFVNRQIAGGGGGGGIGSLRFRKSQTHHVNHGQFYIPNQNYSHFFWERWIKVLPDPLGVDYVGYDKSPGYGGAHEDLHGYRVEGNFATVTGNLHNGVAVVEYTKIGAKFPLEQWIHIANGWDGTNFYFWQNGVLCGVQPYSGLRKTPGDASNGTLFVAGSEHLNVEALIAQLRGYEGVGKCRFNADFAPERYFRPGYFDLGTNIASNCEFLANYMSPATVFPNLGAGHEGRDNTGTFGGFGVTYAERAIPYYSNITHPEFVPGDITNSDYVPPALPIPADAVVYDDFSRQNITPATHRLDGLTLGNTRGGSAGVKTWSGSGQGILHGTAFIAYNGVGSVVDTGIQNQDVSVSREVNNYCRTGLFVRYKNANNYIRVVATPAYVYVNVRESGVNTDANLGAPPANFERLRVVANGTNLKIYLDNVQFGADILVNSAAASFSAGIADLDHYAAQVWRYKEFLVRAI